MVKRQAPAPRRNDAEKAVDDLLRLGDGILWEIKGKRLYYFAEQEMRANVDALPEDKRQELLAAVAQMSGAIARALAYLIQ